MKLIAAIRMKNEEWILHYLLSALSEFVDGIVIVDDGSTDDSIKIARSYSKVIDIHINKPSDENDIDEPRDWNKLTRLAKKNNADWILYTDADEMVEPKIKDLIRGMLKCTDVDVYRFRKVSPWMGIERYRVDKPRYNHPAKNVLNPILVRSTKKLRWTNGRGGWFKKIVKRVVRGDKLKPNYGRVFPSGVNKSVKDLDDLVSIHFNHVDFDRLLRKQVFYALREKEVRPDKSRDELISWVAKGWSEQGAKFAKVNPEWIWKNYINKIKYNG